ncbi:MAG: HAMP domain-containing histidine kinase [Phycisphaerales bacterium]|nr:HAMP domain-containing histidine kinase [Phycisphaerales bacterium]
MPQVLPTSHTGPGPSVTPPTLPATPALHAHDQLPTLTLHELSERLGWFVKIRWYAGAAALTLVLIGRYGFGVAFPLAPVVLIVTALLVYNAIFHVLVRRAYQQARISVTFVHHCANAQIICDMLTLAVLMHFTGGVENPFIVFFACPLVIAAELLPNRVAYLHALLGAVLINLIAWLEFSGWLPHIAVERVPPADAYHDVLSVMKFSVAVSLLPLAVVFLGGSISRRLRQREAELEVAHADLGDLERSKSFLMRQTSHDLRAPLDTLVSMLRAAVPEVHGHVAPRVAQLLDRAEQRATGLMHFVEELHRYATLREVMPTVPKAVVPLHEVVDESLDFHETQAVQHGLRLHRAVHAELYVWGNRETLSEVVGNLLSNAIRYTPPEGEIYVTAARYGDEIRIAVRDTGIGIPVAAQARIFEEFYRAPNAKEHARDGTGMGLAIVQRIVTAHAGRICVRSTLGQGTTFEVVLPAAHHGEPPSARVPEHA